MRNRLSDGLLRFRNIQIIGFHRVVIHCMNNPKQKNRNRLKLLNYLKGYKTKSEVTQKNETAVKNSKVKKGWRKAYMTYAMKLREQLERGIEIGTITTLSKLVDNKLLTIEEAASEAKLSVEDFINLTKKYLETVC